MQLLYLLSLSLLGYATHAFAAIDHTIADVGRLDKSLEKDFWDSFSDIGYPSSSPSLQASKLSMEEVGDFLLIDKESEWEKMKRHAIGKNKGKVLDHIYTEKSWGRPYAILLGVTGKLVVTCHQCVATYDLGHIHVGPKVVKKDIHDLGKTDRKQREVDYDPSMQWKAKADTAWLKEREKIEKWKTFLKKDWLDKEESISTYIKHSHASLCFIGTRKSDGAGSIIVLQEGKKESVVRKKYAVQAPITSISVAPPFFAVLCMDGVAIYAIP